MPSCKRDTIKLVVNRIALLSSLREQYNEFDVELLDLLRKAWPTTIATNSPGVNSMLSPSANAAATLLGVQGLLTTNQQSDNSAKLLITRQVLEGFLSVTTDADVVGHEIDAEFKVLDRMERRRDRAVQLTNNVNFSPGKHFRSRCNLAWISRNRRRCARYKLYKHHFLSNKHCFGSSHHGGAARRIATRQSPTECLSGCVRKKFRAHQTISSDDSISQYGGAKFADQSVQKRSVDQILERVESFERQYQTRLKCSKALG